MITDCGIHLGEEGSRDRGMGMTDRGKVGGVHLLEKTCRVGAGQEMKLKTGSEVTRQGAERGRLGDRPTDPETRRLRWERGDQVIPRKAELGRQRLWKH